MGVDPKVDRIGGTASLLFGMICAWFARMDWQAQQSIWKVWSVLCVVLVLNGVAMWLHAGRAGASRT